jgi:hypothetical protein
MNTPELRIDQQTRNVVDEGIGLLRLKGFNAAVSFLYEFGVSPLVIERILTQEQTNEIAGFTLRRRANPKQIADVIATYELDIRFPFLPKVNTKCKWPLPAPTVKDLVASAQLATGADSVGVSVFDESRDHFSWIEIVGEFERYKGKKVARHHSMCAMCLQTAESQLFIRPHNFFEWMETEGVLVKEALVTPIQGVTNHHFGTLWAVANFQSNVEFTAAHLGLLKMHASALRVTI